MTFTEPHAAQVLDGRKRQTRRPVKPGDMASHNEKGDIVAVFRKGRLLWRVGKDYAVQPGRGKKAIGRTPPLKAIRRERLQKISIEDLVAELGEPEGGLFGGILIFPFIELWDSLYRKPYRWEDDIEVWVLEFERA